MISYRRKNHRYLKIIERTVVLTNSLKFKEKLKK
jgi:hypothetical protein